MTDIVERQRASQPDGTTGGYLLNDAADEINLLRQQIAGFPHLDDMRQAMIDTANENESLRQRVAELEGAIGLERIAHHHELAALKAGQGEPVAWIPTDALDQLKAPRVALLNVPLVTYEAENHSPLYTSAPSIPEGWQLVPVKPTPEMLAPLGRFAPIKYKRMLAAAPKHTKETK